MNEGAFTRNYTMFGLLVVVIFCGIFLMEFWQITGFLLLTLIVFFAGEYSFHRDLGKSLEDQGSPSKVFLIEALAFIGVAIFAGAVSTGRVSQIPLDPTGLGLMTVYCRSLLVSTSIFSLFLAFKIIAVTTGLIRLLTVKRGCFAILHRVLVLLRSLWVTPYWVAYFSDSTTLSMWSVVFGSHSGFLLVRAYVVLKCVYCSQLIWDLDSVRRGFHASAGTEIPKFAFFDGAVSFSAVFCCF